MRTTSLKKPRVVGSEKLESNDLLIAIFILMPLKSVLRCRCVSKRWNNILCDPYFLECYSIKTRHDQLCGGRRLLAFVQDGRNKSVPCTCRFTRRRPAFATNGRNESVPCPCRCTKILPIAQLNKLKMKQLPNKSGTFVHCADGLILCHVYGFNYCVLNPLNRTWVKLPPMNYGTLSCAGLVCEENTEKLVPSFRVVGVLMCHVNKLPKGLSIGTYSSKTRKWKVSELVANKVLNEDFIKKTFVYNGVFHWYYQMSYTHMLLVYDPRVDENYVRLMDLPFGARCAFGLTRSLSADELWIGMADSKRTWFWMLPKDESGGYKSKTTVTHNEWILMHTIDNDSLSKDMMIMLESNGTKKSKSKAVSFLKLEALIPSHPLVAVLSLEQNVFLYNLEAKTTELVKYRGRSLAKSTICGWIPFLGSPYLSTFGSLGKAYW